MGTIALSRSSLVKPIRKKPLSEQIEVGLTTVLVVIGVVLSLLCLLYLFYANEKATQDYHLRVLEEKRAELVQAHERISMQIADLQSLQALSQNEQIARMENASNPLYIRDTQYAQEDQQYAKN